jgi:hypothetical protein
VLVFYFGYILYDKNTLCNGCILTGLLILFRIFKLYGQVLISSHVPCHKFLEDVHEDSMQNFKSANRFLCNRLDWPLKGSRLLAVSRNSSDADVRTLRQRRPNARSSFSNFYTELNFSRHYLESFCKTSGRRDNTSRRYPAFQNIPGFLYERGKEIQRRQSGS